MPKCSPSVLITDLQNLNLLFSHELLEPGMLRSVTELFIHNPRLGLLGYNSFKISYPPSYHLLGRQLGLGEIMASLFIWLRNENGACGSKETPSSVHLGAKHI